MDKNTKKSEEEIRAEETFPGAAIDAADDDKVTKKAVKERTKTLNNNPRNHDL